MKKVIYSLVLLLFSINGYSQGHYSGSSFNPNDYFAPHEGIIIPVWYGFANMNYYNGQGKKTDQLINNFSGNPNSLTIKQNVKTDSYILMAIYGGKGKILNANWGMMLIPMVNSPTASIALDYYSQQTGAGTYNFTNKTVGLGDMYIQPIWLSWKDGNFQYALNYGVWAPTGKYEPNSLDNGGHGYWSQNIRVAVKYKPAPKINVSAAHTLEINHWQKKTDFKEGTHLTFDMGGSYVLNSRGDEIGVFGHYTTQISDDKGTEGSKLSDQVGGVGGFVSYWIIPKKLGAMARITQNFSAENRFAGTAIQTGLNILIPTSKEEH
ncbi:SphA family protein [Algoriella sp.]|uniref:SphA family protein n=1 Tax=Algoriella sp. TaxID=1872434 RepID=UPI002FC6055E